ncbi:Phosphoserine phosphatase RsbP [compost metagenome]
MFIASVLKDTVNTYVEPEKVIQELNRRFSQLHIDSQLVQYYFTAIYLVVDTKFKRIDYVNAGHPPGLLYMEDGSLSMLETGCPPVGLFDKIEAETRSITYKGNGHIVLYTDGLLEAVEGTQDEQIDYLARNLAASHRLDTQKMQEMFFDDNVPQEREDDKCLVWISLKEGEGRNENQE